MTDDEGCATWGAAEPCPSDKRFCSNGACAASCVDECSASGTRACASPGYHACGQFDSDPCLEWSAALPCGPGEVCRESDAACVLDCGGSSCPCDAGQTKVCDAVGECKGGFRNCVNGEFGTCHWQQGPTNEQCDNKDNDCDGVPDNHLVAQPCDKQAGVCQGSVKTCAGGQWLSCSGADYAAYASSHGGPYEAVESTCDGKDDCNGKADDVSTCCQPNCVGKVCGADNGCGSQCQEGSCGGAQDVCSSGKCVCQPDCAFKMCGTSDGCGKTCATGCSVCTPGAKQCSGSTPQACGANGQWKDGTACGGTTPVCIGGQCVLGGYDSCMGYNSWPIYGSSPSCDKCRDTTCLSQATAVDSECPDNFNYDCSYQCNSNPPCFCSCMVGMSGQCGPSLAALYSCLYASCQSACQ